MSKNFVPQFWNSVDKRLGLVREIKRRYELLKQDAGVDSYQKDLLAQRAVFVAIQLETLEHVAAETGKFDAGVYTQMVNCLHGILKALGIERAEKPADLAQYLERKKGGGN